MLHYLAFVNAHSNSLRIGHIYEKRQNLNILVIGLPKITLILMNAQHWLTKFIIFILVFEKIILIFLAIENAMSKVRRKRETAFPHPLNQPDIR